MIAMAMKYNEREYKCFGKPIEYEQPLTPRKTELMAGESSRQYGDIDLLSKKKNVFYLIELKREDTNETFLRCSLEIYTYFKQGRDVLKEELGKKFEEDVVLCPAIMIFQGSKPELHFREIMKKNKDSNLYNLLCAMAADIGNMYIIVLSGKPGTKHHNGEINFTNNPPFTGIESFIVSHEGIVEGVSESCA